MCSSHNYGHACMLSFIAFSKLSFSVTLQMQIMELDKEWVELPLIASIHGGDMVWYSSWQSLSLLCFHRLCAFDLPWLWSMSSFLARFSDSSLAFSALSLTLSLSLSLFLSFFCLILSLFPANLSSGQAQCPSYVHLVPMPSPLRLQVVEWILLHPSTAS